MQIVLSGNRVIAHGDNCFLSMGGTVICEDTGKAYQNATIAEVDTIPADIDSVGYEHHAGIFVPVAPYGKTEDGYLMAACFECGTPRSTDITIKAVRERLNTYATIVVTYPEGSVCTCEKDGVILTAEDTSGSYAFNVHEAGTWIISITNGTDTAEKTVAITKRWQYETVSITYFSATINATYPAGSVCTCTDGVTTLTAPNTSGQYAFIVPNAGTWTVSITDGTQTKSETVSISTENQVETVTLALWNGELYSDGNEWTTVTGGWVATNQVYAGSVEGVSINGATPTLSKEDTQMIATVPTGSGVGSGAVRTTNQIDLTDYSTITLVGTISASHPYDYLFVMSTTGNYGGAQAKAQIKTGTVTLDVSTLSGVYYIGIGLYNRGKTYTMTSCVMS